MSFSRDLGGPRGETLKPGDVIAAAERATAHVRGVLSDDEKAELDRLRNVVMSGRELGQNDKNRLRHLHGVSEGPQHDADEIALMAKCAELAKHGVELMGGDAHVHFGGSCREVEDMTAIDASRATAGSPDPLPEGIGRSVGAGAPAARVVQSSITVTITVTRPRS